MAITRDNSPHGLASCVAVGMEKENDGAVTIICELKLNDGTVFRPHCVIAPSLASRKSEDEMKEMARESLSSPDQIEDWLKHGRFIVGGSTE